MKNIYIISDFLMTSGSEQDNNIRWVSDLISRPIELSTSRKPQCFSTKKWNSLNFDQAVFFSLSDIDYREEKQFFFHDEDITEESLLYLNDKFGRESLLIGYELSEQTKNILNKTNITYIDIWLHPIRYLDDVLFGIKSNDNNINSELHKFNISSESYYLYADRLRVQNYRGHRRSKAHIKDDSALFIGQTLNDKAIFSNGHMLNLLNFKDKFESVTKQYKHVYYSRHPFVKEGDEEILNYLKKFKNVSINDDPTYHLLASDEIKYVFSISSSVVHEAKYFGKTTDFLFKPVITIGDSKENYTSVMHEIFYGSFWSSILSPVIKVNNVPVVSFFSGKDKIRDALSFYWGYRNIDKAESLKQTVSKLWNKNNKMNDSKKPKKIQSIYDYIIDKKIISFDIFDTLITRKTFSPREIFNFVEIEYNSRHNEKIREFKQFRVIAEEKALENAKLNGKQDCTLEEIYTSFKKILMLDDSVCKELMSIELEQELSNIIPRERGIELFDYAKKLNKKIVLISDMYLNSEIIQNILKRNFIHGYDKLYVSSEIGLKKKTGDLFKFVINDNEITTTELVHIGDNIDGDVRIPQEMGITSYHLPRSIDNGKFYAPEMKAWIDSISVNKTPLLDAIVTTITNRYYDDESITKSSLYLSDKHKFGYQAFGPLIIGFASWIKKVAKDKNINKLYFLSRDTKIVFDCYKIMYPNDNIELNYLYSSRRSVNIPLLKTKSDLLVEVYKTIYSTKISTWLENRFGLTTDLYSIEILQKYGLKDYDHLIGGKFSKDVLSQLIFELSDTILDNAEKERLELVDYLSSNGMNTNDDVAVVDIGYAATMQSAYQELLNKDNIHGIYYATFNTALKNVSDPALLNGYSVNLGNPSSPNYGICTHRFFYETIFCDADNSFIKPIRQGDTFDIIKSNFDDSIRQAVVQEIHSGVISLAQDLAKNYSSKILSSQADASITSLLFDAFLKKPDQRDAEMFKGVLFEDAVVPNSRRYLYLPDELRNDKTAVSNMIWKDAVNLFFTIKSESKNQAALSPALKIDKTALSNKVDIIDRYSTNQSKGIVLEAFFFKMLLKGKKKNKYIRDRDSFFHDSNNKMLSNYFNSIGKKL